MQIKTTKNNQLLAVLADGLGGHGGGQIASSIAVETVCAGWNGSSTPAALTELITQAHRSILSRQAPDLPMKSTIVALSLSADHADWAYAGDSRLYQFFNGKPGITALPKSPYCWAKSPRIKSGFTRTEAESSVPWARKAG